MGLPLKQQFLVYIFQKLLLDSATFSFSSNRKVLNTNEIFFQKSGENGPLMAISAIAIEIQNCLSSKVTY